MQKNNTYALLDVRRASDADRLSMEAGISGEALMENAGNAVFQEIKKHWAPCNVTVFCGPGNNGGDGFVTARLLSENGWKVRVGLYGTPGQLKGDARHHCELWNGKIDPLSPTLLENTDLIVDALFGAGLSRPLEKPVIAVLEAAEEKGVPIVAVDVPSGVMGDTGEALGAVAAKLTVTFFRKKPGHLLLPARALCGEIVVADIGIKPSVFDRVVPDAFENNPELWRDDLPSLAQNTNKYMRGHALVYGGYPMTGAARLCARASARMGSGLTTIACPEIAFPIYAPTVTSIMVQSFTSPEGLKAIIKERKISALLIGPGAGVNDNTRALAVTGMAGGLPAVLDADAITVFKGNAALLKKSISHPCVMTPHEGEFKRVFDFTGDKISRARSAAKYTGAVIVLKGNDTVIVSPEGCAIINSNAPATLATAGSGDVLSGFILGLLAQGMDAFPAAAAAVWMHGEAANLFGPGLIAEDIPEALPEVFRKNFSVKG